MIPWVGDSSFVIHVSKSGDDANGGVAQQYPVSLANDAKLTISSAVSACPDGGIIIVWPGDYAETVDIKTAAKKITLIGVSYRGSRIVPTSGKGVIGYAGLHLENISVEVQDDTSMAVDCENADDCLFRHCFVHSKGIDGIYASISDRVVIDNCYVFASYDSVIIGNYGLIKDSIIVTDGCYTGSGLARAIGGAGVETYLRLINSIVIAQPSYEKPGGKEPELYESDRDLYAIKDFGKLMLDDCILIADGYKPTGAHADSYASGNSYGIFTVWQAMLRNCSILSKTDQNQSATIAYGLYNSIGQLENVNIETAGQEATYDFYATSAKELWLANTKYDSSKVHSNVTVKAVPDSDGGVNAAGKALLAAKSLVNKAVQNKATGAIDYYDDDSETVILTQTPDDGQSTIVRVPS